jgi:ribosomal protein S13
MDWTVAKKMFLIGFISAIGICITAGNNILTSRSINKYSQIEALINDQINTVNKTLQSQLTLMLNAMDAIIDKDRKSQTDTVRAHTTMHRVLQKDISQKSPKNKMITNHQKEVRPDQVIPFDDDDDFKDF